MSWEMFAAAISISSLLLAVVGYLRGIRKDLVATATQDAEHKGRVNHRLEMIEHEHGRLSTQLTDHMKTTAQELHAIRNELPSAIAGAVAEALTRPASETRQRTRRAK